MFQDMRRASAPLTVGLLLAATLLAVSPPGGATHVTWDDPDDVTEQVGQSGNVGCTSVSGVAGWVYYHSDVSPAGFVATPFSADPRIQIDSSSNFEATTGNQCDGSTVGNQVRPDSTGSGVFGCYWTDTTSVAPRWVWSEDQASYATADLPGTWTAKQVRGCGADEQGESGDWSVAIANGTDGEVIFYKTSDFGTTWDSIVVDGGNTFFDGSLNLASASATTHAISWTISSGAMMFAISTDSGPG